MQMTDIPFGTTDWSKVPAVESKGETGFARWRSLTFGTINVHMAELKNGRVVKLTPGMSYQVADETRAHRSRTGPAGVKLFLVD